MEPKPTIATIDDDPILCAYLRGVLEPLNYRVLEAHSGAEGLALCLREQPDLVLLDLRLEDMPGTEVCARLREAEPLRDTPILFLSGVPEPEEKVAAFRAGAVDYITKPFASEELEVRIAHHLAFHRQRAELEKGHRELRLALHDSDQMNRALFEVNESLLRSEVVKGDFISNIRNEINDPLCVLLALAQNIASGAVPQDQVRTSARIILNEALRLDFQIRNIVCAAEMVAGDASPQPSQLDIEAILEEVVGSLVHLAAAKEIVLEVQLQPPPPTEPFGGDGPKLRIIFANLLANALEFSPPRARVQVRTKMDHDHLELSVTDAGPGIPKESQGTIFEPFVQLETGSTRSHHGHGLGLSIVKSLVEILGGLVELHSEPNQGATFLVRLPRLEPPVEGHETSFDGSLFLFDDAEEM